MQTMHFIAILLHILAAIVWIGGMVCLGAVLIPVLRQSRTAGGQYTELIHRTGTRFRNVGWTCLAILVLTGVANLSRWGVGIERLTSSELWASPWGRILAVKLVLVAAALAMSGVHDFVVGPRATRTLRESPGSEKAGRLRRAAGWMGRTNLLIAVLVVALGIMLVRGLPT
jgi:copper resistance protein D